MLKNLVPKLACPTCKDTQAEMQLHVFNDGQNGHVRDGILVCKSCSAWYPIENELLELVPAALVDPVTARELPLRFAAAFAAAKIESPDSGGVLSSDTFADQIKQREHFDDFAEGVMPDYTKLHFLQASAQRYISLWKAKLTRPGTWLLDVGCGTGLSSFPYTENHTVIGFDISKKTIRRDIEEANRRGCAAKTTFFVGDGSFLAFKDASFDYAHTFGSLHHLPNPSEAISQIQRVLVSDGLHFAVENNTSMFRGVFDLMMKITPLWIEEAGAEPLISRQMVDEWCRGKPFRISSETSIFLPPHLVNILPQKMATQVVEWSDRFFSSVPILRKHGGQLIFTIAKARA